MEILSQRPRRQPEVEVCDINGLDVMASTLSEARRVHQDRLAEERARQQRLLQAMNMTIGVKPLRDVRITPLREI